MYLPHAVLLGGLRVKARSGSSVILTLHELMTMLSEGARIFADILPSILPLPWPEKSDMYQKYIVNRKLIDIVTVI